MTCPYQVCFVVFQLVLESSKTDFMHMKMTQLLLQCVSGSASDCVIGCLPCDDHYQLEFIVYNLCRIVGIHCDCISELSDTEIVITIQF